MGIFHLLCLFFDFDFEFLHLRVFNLPPSDNAPFNGHMSRLCNSLTKKSNWSP